MSLGFRLLAIACIALSACEIKSTSKTTNNKPHDSAIVFTDVSENIGLKSQATWKYGGPAIADFNNDGIYDFVLTNHHEVPAVLYYGSQDGALQLHGAPIQNGDVHGIAPGDYDGDGDVDIIVSVGGGNGKVPSPPRLLRNDSGTFVDVTETAGIANLGARGRSVRWIDIDADGDLDLLQVVARQLPGETGPRNILFENIGSGKFEYRESPAFEQIEAERVLVTDFNNDHVPDLVLFEPLSIWEGDGTFIFKNVTESVLPPNFDHAELITAVADADFDNDGDRDLYLSRGKTYYQIANNSLDFDPKTKRLDLRDEGNEGHDGLSFTAISDVNLSRFWHWPRGVDLTLPVYLGANKTPIETPVESIKITRESANGFPETITENGWYLGHLGEGKWRFEWRLKGNLAWDLRASIDGVESIQPDWVPQDYNNVPDVLLRNEGGVFVDTSALLPESSKGNNWGVTHGDFDNDGYEDFFVYRFGKLSQRIPDLLLRNNAGKAFKSIVNHGAFAGGTEVHGDMGAAFDYDLDGRIDLLNGDDNAGRWHLYRNNTPTSETSNHLLVRVGYSDNFIDPLGATVTVVTPDGKRQTKDIGSAGAVHSQSLMNILHFGTGHNSNHLKVKVRWRDGGEQILSDISAGQTLSVGDNLEPRILK